MMAAVTLSAEATERSVGIVGAVASGAGESLGLGLEPATRLNAIAIEAASNVVAHAYPGSSGPFELEIVSPEEASVQELRVVVRDSGTGILTAATQTESRGLGLTVICALADEIEIKSTPASGTSLAAVIQPDGWLPPAIAEPPETDPRSGGMLTFVGTTFLESVLPRTLAALVAGSTTAIDALTSVLNIGDAIAYGLSSVVVAEETTAVHWGGESPREIRIGPFQGDAIGDLLGAVAGVEPRSESWLEREASPGGSGDYALVGLPQT